MAGKTVLLDLDGEVKQQTSLPERFEHAEQLETVGLGHLQQGPALWDPVALWCTGRFTTGGAAAVGDTGL